MDFNVVNTALGNGKGDLLIKDGTVIDVFNGTAEKKDLLIKNGIIAACGRFEEDEAERTVSAEGQYLLPGFIDAHIHIESSHMTPAAFGRAILAKGTSAVIADPHEIANVCGKDGIAYMMESAKDSPADIFFMIPSSVPATDKETSGAVITAADTAELLEKYTCSPGLGEVMNVPGVIYGDKETAGKLAAADGRIKDGHFPLGSGRALSAYAAAGITSDHESVSAEEVREKLSCGIDAFLREGSSATNLRDLLPAVNDHNHSRVCFCADDISSSDIEAHGDILNCVRIAVSEGMDPLRAVEIATINAAKHYHLENRGALAPGYLADITAVDNLKDFHILSVWKNGELYTEEETPLPKEATGRFELKNKDFSFPKAEGRQNARVIKAFPGQLITEERIYPAEELPPDINLLYVAERHGKKGSLGCGLIEGFGLKRGAIASSVAHDSHNLIILASDEKEAAFAAEVLEQSGGGMAVTENGTVKAVMELPAAGLMSSKSVHETAKAEQALAAAAKELGITMNAPFMTLSFMALPVIAKLKLTDLGLFDVDRFDFVPLYF